MVPKTMKGNLMNSKNTQKKIKKVLTRKVIEQANRGLLDLDFDKMDEEMVIGWHKATGLKVEEWMKYMFQYGRERSRKICFGLSPYGTPVVYFDASTEEEWNELVGKKKEEKIMFLDEQGFKHDEVKRKFKMKDN